MPPSSNHPYPEVEAEAHAIAAAVKAVVRPGRGFVVLAFDFTPDEPTDGPTNRLAYVSNAQRPDIVRAMLEWIEHQGVR